MNNRTLIASSIAAVVAGGLALVPSACAAPDRSQATAKRSGDSMTAKRRTDAWVGVNAQRLPHIPAERAAAHVAAIRHAGMDFVRMDAPWALAEVAPPGLDGRHHYDWAWLDRFATLFAANRLEWLPVLGVPPGWAMRNEGRPWAPPANDRHFADFAGALARRYGAGGSFWREHPDLPYRPVGRYEIWNEPDQKWFWWPTPDPAHYARLYLAARRAIKAADPNAQTLTAGMSNSQETTHAYVEQMFRSAPGLAQQIDGFGWHPYAPTIEDSWLATRRLRALLDRLGAATVPIDITEMGWSTAPGVSRDHDLVADEDARARDLPRALASYLASNCGVRSFAAHTWVTQQREPTDIEDWFGLYNLDGTPTPSGRAYVRAVRRITRPTRSPRREAPFPICARDQATNVR